MFACSQCFIDNELVSHINSQSTQLGDCNFCNSRQIKIIDTRELSGFFFRFLKAYLPCNVNETGEQLFDLIINDWKIFAANASYKFALLNSIFEGFDDYNEILSKRYKPILLSNPLAELGATSIENWNQFSLEIKTKNRFHLSKQIDLKLLNEWISNTCSFTYKKDKLFYRARITNHIKGWSVHEMGKPPAEKTTAGRANPKGIPYLYLSNNEKTILFETRSYAYDYVTIAEYQLIENITVAKLQNIDTFSPFIFDEDIVGNFLALRSYLIILEQELSRPLRRGDNELDYLPSQYLCEFIKSIKFDGVEYRSSLYNGGFNIALFNDDKIKCVSVKTVQVEIKDIDTQTV